MAAVSEQAKRAAAAHCRVTFAWMGGCSGEFGGRGRGWTSARPAARVLQLPGDLSEEVGIGIGAGKADADPPDGDADLRPDLEQFVADGVAAGARQSGTFQPEAAQLVEQDIGKRGQIEPDLVDTHPMG